MADLKIPELNSVIIAGNLTKDPVCRQTTNGTPVINFTIATNRRYRDASNQWQEDVCYVGVVAWNKLAISCKERLKKGSAVLIEGELQSRSWKSEDGSPRHTVEIKARRIQFLNRVTRPSVEAESTTKAIFEEDQSSFEDDSFERFLSNDEADILRGQQQ